MAPTVAIICFINDPFDLPGAKRIGGGHLVLKQLGEFLVGGGFDVTYVTRKNDPAKPTFRELGPRCRIHRLPVGPPAEMAPADVGLLLDDLEVAAKDLMAGLHRTKAILHSQYWIAGEVCRRLNKTLNLRHIHHLLSLGRQKKMNSEQMGRSEALRLECELNVFNTVDCLVAQCPSEARELLNLYPEISHRRIAIIPHGIDQDAFAPRR